MGCAPPPLARIFGLVNILKMAMGLAFQFCAAFIHNIYKEEHACMSFTIIVFAHF
jgi:hypothetical protein